MSFIRNIAIIAILAATTGSSFSETKKYKYKRFAASGQTVEISNTHNLDINCSVTGETKLVIIKAPKNGTLHSATKEYYSSYNKTNSRFKCNDKRSTAHAVEFKAGDTAKGKERFTYGVIFSDGEMWQYDVEMTIY